MLGVLRGMALGQHLRLVKRYGRPKLQNITDWRSWVFLSRLVAGLIV